MTSEELHGVAEQPADTCPLIDDATASVRKALSLLKGHHRMELDELRDACARAEWEIDSLLGVRGDLELIRERAGLIRDWGEEWKQLTLTKESSNQ